MAPKGVVLALAVLLAAPAFADGDAVQAKRLFVSGSKHFDLGAC